MEAGKLRHRVTIQSPRVEQNELGEAVRTWPEWGKRWAQVTPLTGRELTAARQIMGEVTHQVAMRWFDGLTPAMRIVFGTRVLEILAVLNVEERNRELRVLCRENVNG